MKKLFTWALVAAVMTAGAAFAGPVSSLNAGRMFIQPNATFAGGAGAFNFTGGASAVGSGPTTTNNDDSCDIGTAPAATLLLPFFEVDFRQPSNNALNTNFTITNVSQFPQVAHITIWSDRSFPVLDFNIYLTGYDVQGINLYDIIARGQVPPTGAGTATTAFLPFSPNGPRSIGRAANPNFIQNAAGTGVDTAAFFTACGQLPGQIPGAPAAGSTVATSLLLDIQNALSIGSYSTCPTPAPGTGPGVVGSNRGATGTARGYVTVDVANTCSQTLPTTASYYQNEILFDNVLIGDYQRINPRSGALAGAAGDAGGNPMVHIRAIPEGGLATSTATVNLPFTFYDRYTPGLNRKADRRQPLPGTFAARFIQGGTGSMNTALNIWREGVTSGTATEACAVSANANIPTTELVRFDERENPSAFIAPGCQFSPCPINNPPTFGFPETSSTDTGTSAGGAVSGAFPQLVSPAGDVGGWMYLNLNNGGTPVTNVYSAARAATHPGVSQNWVTITQAADAPIGRYSVEFDAAWLGNGCSPRPGVTGLTSAGPAIGPAGGAITGTNSTP